MKKNPKRRLIIESFDTRQSHQQNFPEHQETPIGHPRRPRSGLSGRGKRQKFSRTGKLESSSRLQSFSLSRNKHGTKKQIVNRPVEEAKKMKCYKRLMYKQFVQVSGPCGPQFLSYLPRHFTHHFRALYGDAIFVYCFGIQIWPPGINKNIWRSLFSTKALSFHSRASIRAHKHIF